MRILALLLLLLAAGCGGADADEAATTPGQAEPPGAGDGVRTGVTVDEARAAGGTQLVRGSLLARDGEVRICSALMESFPPQCAEPSLLVEGLDLGTVTGTTTAEGVTWSEREVQLHGEVDGDVLRLGESG
jgi:hypothetical protein